MNGSGVVRDDEDTGTDPVSWCRRVFEVLQAVLFLVLVLSFIQVILLALGVYWSWLQLFGQAWRGEISVAGEIRLRAAFRDWRFHLEDVRDISLETGPLVARFVIGTVGGPVRLSHRTGRPLVNSILAARPEVEVIGFSRRDVDEEGVARSS